MTRSAFCDSLLFSYLIVIVLATDNEFMYEQLDRGLTNEQEFPYQVSIYFNYNDEFLCAGAVVDSNKVLTLAHCLYYSWGGVAPPIILTVKRGKNDVFDVADVHFHKNFNTTVMEYNFAVLQTSTRLKSDSSLIGSISLVRDVSASSYNNCIVTGRNQDTSGLEVIDVIPIDCGKVYSKKICAQHVSQDITPCKYSLGSLLVCDDILVGILSIVPECNTSNQVLIFENTKYAIDLVGSGESKSSAITSIPPNSIQAHIVSRLIFVVLSLILNAFLIIVMS